MKQRVVLYDAQKWGKDEAVLERILALGTVDRKTLLAVLKQNNILHLNNLDADAAADLHAFFESVGAEADLEPMELPDTERLLLKREGLKWLKRGLILPYQLQNIFTYYGIQENIAGAQAKPKEARSLIQTVLTIGTVLVGLGIILFIASNWKLIPDALKVTGAMTLTLSFLHLGYRYYYGTDDKQKQGKVFFALAIFGIGSNVILLGQMYHVIADSYLLPLVWGLLVWPLGILMGYRPAISFAVGAWLLGHFLYQGAYGRSSGFFPVLFLGLFLPYAMRLKDEKAVKAAIVLICVALVSAVPVSDLYAATLWLLVLIFFFYKRRDALLEYLLMAGLMVWNIIFVSKFAAFPNIFYLLPLAYFTYRAIQLKSNQMMIANIFNFLLWEFLFLYQLHKLFLMPAPEGVEFLFTLLTLGVLFYGGALRLKNSDDWQPLQKALWYGGLCLMVGMVYLLSFRFGRTCSQFYSSIPFLSVTIASLIAGLALASPVLIADIKKDVRNLETLGLLALVALKVVLSLVVPCANSIHVALSNVILFFTAFLFMVRGQRFQRIAFYQCGIALFIVLIGSRYFDSFMAYMPRSIFFILGGVFLIGWAFFIDRQKKKFSESEGGADD